MEVLRLTSPRLVLLALLAGSLIALGCSSRSRGGTRLPPGVTDGGGGGGTDGGVSFDGRPPPPPPGDNTCEKMDILFVIDDSGSMAEEQSNLTTNFPLFIDVLESFTTESGSAIDYRVGVTTTGRDTTTEITFPPSFPLPPMVINESGPNGALQTGSGCGLSRPWIERAEGDVATKFSCVAQVGTSGSSIEMPLLMTERALTDRVADGSNAGFLREDALLAVVVLTDEDDCSRTDNPITIEVPDPLSMPTAAADECDPSIPEIEPLSRFLTAIDAVKGERGRWAMAVIAGPGPGTCTSSFGEAYEATRLQQFLTEAGDNTTFSSICEGDLSSALMDALNTFDAACQTFPPLI